MKVGDVMMMLLKKVEHKNRFTLELAFSTTSSCSVVAMNNKHTPIKEMTDAKKKCVFTH